MYPVIKLARWITFARDVGRIAAFLAVCWAGAAVITFLALWPLYGARRAALLTSAGFFLNP